LKKKRKKKSYSEGLFMGNEVSAEGGEAPAVGYHVLRVNPGSPGHVAGLIPFFDFIVSVGTEQLTQEDSTLVETLQVRLLFSFVPSFFFKKKNKIAKCGKSAPTWSLFGENGPDSYSEPHASE
jgi:hypothetical protein